MFKHSAFLQTYNNLLPSMASHLLYLLPLFLLLTTTNAQNTTNVTTNTLPIHTPPQHTSPLPHQVPKPTPDQEIRYNSIIDAILRADEFAKWAHLFPETDPSQNTFTTTLFIPDENAFMSKNLPPPALPFNFLDPNLFPYHIVPRKFTFEDLLVYPIGARLPTLLEGNTLLITNNSATNFTINGAKITRPNLIQNGVVTAHVVDGILDYNVYGIDPSKQQSLVKDTNNNNNTDTNFLDVAGHKGGNNMRGISGDRVDNIPMTQSFEFPSATDQDARLKSRKTGPQVSSAAAATKDSWVTVVVAALVFLALVG